MNRIISAKAVVAEERAACDDFKPLTSGEVAAADSALKKTGIPSLMLRMDADSKVQALKQVQARL